jgi:FkbM family methyltransferase
MLRNILCHTIYTDPMAKLNKPIIIDCGANKGEFSSYLNEEFNAICYAFEPDPRLFSGLIKKHDINYYELAVGSKDGLVRLNLGEKHCSSIKYSESDSQDYLDVQMVSLEKFCKEREIKVVDLLKVDIEGAELDLFENFSKEFLEKIRQVTIEFHDHLNKGDIPRIKAIIKKMKKNGFYVLNFSHFTYGDIMMINKNYINLSLKHRISFNVFKYFVGIKRFLKKINSRNRN